MLSQAVEPALLSVPTPPACPSGRPGRREDVLRCVEVQGSYPIATLYLSDSPPYGTPTATGARAGCRAGPPDRAHAVRPPAGATWPARVRPEVLGFRVGAG